MARALWDGGRSHTEGREQQGLGLVRTRHQDLDRRRAAVGRETHTIGELMGDPVDAADSYARIRGGADRR